MAKKKSRISSSQEFKQGGVKQSNGVTSNESGKSEQTQ
jgi:hypothetical protein